MLVCKTWGNGRAMAEVVYFDANGRELGMDSVALCGAETSGINLPRDPTAGSGALSVWPNPASTGFTVGFTVRSRDAIEIEVYDLLGRKVLARAAGTLDGGAHELAIDAADLPGGTYFVRVRGGGADGVRQGEVGR